MMKTVLLTGDSRGVGLTILKSLIADTEYRIVGISRKQSSESIEIEKKYEERYKHLNFDLSNPSEVPKFYKNSLKVYGPYIGFINNAAIAYDDIITNLKIEPLEKMYAVNVFSPMLITKYILRDMLLHKEKGSIVHLSSISAHTGYKGLSMYASTKGALEAFSKNTAREWGELGIRSNIVCPGFMATDMSGTLSDEQKERVFKRNSLKKEVDIKGVADTTLFLLGDGSISITGQIIHVDNGTI